jgi:hypothetical protein
MCGDIPAQAWTAPLTVTALVLMRVLLGLIRLV